MLKSIFNRFTPKFKHFILFNHFSYSSSFKHSSMEQEEIPEKPTEALEDIRQRELNTVDSLKEALNSSQIIQEGYAKIQKSYRESNSDGKTTESEVFYNPVQVFNRDLTVLVIHMFTQYLKEKRKDKFKPITILDALSASGLRTIRFSKELKDINQVYANDISEASLKLMNDNFKLNDLDLSKIKVTLKDAIQLLYETKFKIATGDFSDRFDVIDLDPYGTVAPFLDAAIQSANGETLLCLTSTDSRILCGPDTQKCFYLYGTSRAKVAAFQENAIRIVMNTVNNVANRYGKYIRPLISFQSEFYVRIFLIVEQGKAECAKSLVKVGNVYHCDNCQNHSFQSFGKKSKAKSGENDKYVPAKMTLGSTVCDQCEQDLAINGPIWIGELNDAEFVSKTIEYLNSEQFDLPLVTKKKIQGILHSIQLEQKDGLDAVPLGHHFEHICKTMKTTVPSKKKLQSAFKSLNFNIEQSYLNPAIFKTNAPPQIVFDVIRNWRKEQQSGEVDNQQQFAKNNPSLKVVSKESICTPNWDLEFEREQKMARWLPNPEKNWGPGKRAVIKRLVEDSDENDEEEEIPKEDQENGDSLLKKSKQG